MGINKPEGVVPTEPVLLKNELKAQFNKIENSIENIFSKQNESSNKTNTTNDSIFANTSTKRPDQPDLNALQRFNEEMANVKAQAALLEEENMKKLGHYESPFKQFEVLGNKENNK